MKEGAWPLRHVSPKWNEYLPEQNLTHLNYKQVNSNTSITLIKGQETNSSDVVFVLLNPFDQYLFEVSAEDLYA